MKKSIVATLAAGALVFAACGSDSDGSSGSSPADSSASTDSAAEGAPDGVQGEAAAAFLGAASESGIDADKDCVYELASQLSDEDAQAIVDSAPSGDAELSAEGTALTAQLTGCVSSEELVDSYIDTLKESGQPFDEDCVREALDGIDFAELASAAEGDAATEEMLGKVFACFEPSTT